MQIIQQVEIDLSIYLVYFEMYGLCFLKLLTSLILLHSRPICGVNYMLNNNRALTCMSYNHHSLLFDGNQYTLHTVVAFCSLEL